MCSFVALLPGGPEGDRLSSIICLISNAASQASSSALLHKRGASVLWAKGTELDTPWVLRKDGKRWMRDAAAEWIQCLKLSQDFGLERL